MRHQCDTLYDALCAFDKICKLTAINTREHCLLIFVLMIRKIGVCIICVYALACTNVMVVLVIRKPRAGNCVYCSPPLCQGQNKKQSTLFTVISLT
jgi:hypothetical protein